MWVGKIQSIKGLDTTKRQRKTKFDAWAGTSIFSCPWTSTIYGSQDSQHWFPWFKAFKLGWELHHQLSWTSSLQTADCRTFQPLWAFQPISYNKSHSIYPNLLLGICCLKNPNTMTKLLELPGWKNFLANHHKPTTYILLLIFHWNCFNTHLSIYLYPSAHLSCGIHFKYIANIRAFPLLICRSAYL